MEELNILVVEDNFSNIVAAQRMLADHNLTIVSGYDQAHNPLKEKKIDWEAVARDVRADEDFQGWEPDGWDDSEKTYYFIYQGKEVNHRQLFNFPELYKKFKQIKEKNSIAPYDVVLTDVMLPKGGHECMSPEGARLADQQGEMPYGPIIALRALQAGVKHVGILTSGNHHADPFVFAFDYLNGFEIGDVNVVCSNKMDVCVDKNFNPCEYDSKLREAGEIFFVKDWKKLLEKVLG